MLQAVYANETLHKWKSSNKNDLNEYDPEGAQHYLDDA
jgi:hypothetical protein